MSVRDDLLKYIDKELKEKKFLTDAAEFIKEVKLLDATAKELEKSVAVLQKEVAGLSDKKVKAEEGVKALLDNAEAKANELLAEAKKKSDILYDSTVKKTDAMVKNAQIVVESLAEKEASIRVVVENLQLEKAATSDELSKIESALDKAKKNLKAFVGE